jgi:hypothetical protein
VVISLGSRCVRHCGVEDSCVIDTVITVYRSLQGVTMFQLQLIPDGHRRPLIYSEYSLSKISGGQRY